MTAENSQRVRLIQFIFTSSISKLTSVGEKLWTGIKLQRVGIQ